MRFLFLLIFFSSYAVAELRPAFVYTGGNCYAPEEYTSGDVEFCEPHNLSDQNLPSGTSRCPEFQSENAPIRRQDRIDICYKPTGGALGSVDVYYEYIEPPSCSILAGYKFAYEDHFPEDWEYVDEQDCYALCQYVIDRAEGDEPITCTYTGDFKTEPDPNDPDDAPYGNQPDPNSPEFCNVPGEYENECLDWDHPSNNPDENEGCSSGTQYGVVDYGNGPVGICSPSSGGVDGFDYGSGVDTSMDQDGDGQPNSSDNDIDGDGIPNDADPDRDGDGVPNADDPNPDGNQGNGEGQDGTDSQAGEGEGPKGQASTCAKAPKSTGDPQLAAIHLQLWYNRCKGKKIDDVYNAIEKTNEALGKMTEEVGENESDTLVGNVSTGAINDLDTFGDAHIADIGTGSEGGGPMAGIVEGSGVKSFFTSLVPQPQSCSSMQLAFASKFSLPIPCEKFMLFKTWFGSDEPCT